MVYTMWMREPPTSTCTPFSGRLKRLLPAYSGFRSTSFNALHNGNRVKAFTGLKVEGKALRFLDGGDSTSRLRELLNKFEGVRPPSPPKKERIVSGLDPKRGPLSEEAASAREASQNRLSSRSAEAEQAAHPRRYVPRIAATDSDEVRDLKRAILAKEQEITGACTQLKAIADRIDRALEIFLASEIESEEKNATETNPDHRVKAFTVDATKAVEGVVEKPKKQSVGSSPTSLEAILAAARSGQPRASGEKPKYSKLLRDMK